MRVLNKKQGFKKQAARPVRDGSAPREEPGSGYLMKYMSSIQKS